MALTKLLHIRNCQHDIDLVITCNDTLCPSRVTLKDGTGIIGQDSHQTLLHTQTIWLLIQLWFLELKLLLGPALSSLDGVAQ